MSRLFAWLAGSACALTIVAFALPSGASEPALDEAPPAPPAEDGLTVYTDTCAKCHGADGKGDTGMGRKARAAGKDWPDLTKSTIDATKAKEIIEEGVKGSSMKPYKDKLSADALSKVRDYVMLFKAP